MPVSHRHQCIFIHIPKTGGTSIETALGMFHSWKEENTTDMFGKIQTPALIAKGWVTRYLQHVSWAELGNLVPDPIPTRYYSFAWIRNPWDRMVSVFANKDPDLLEHARADGLQLAELDFESFLVATLDYLHVHLRPQHEFILGVQGGPSINFIGRFEHFPADFAALCAALRERGSLAATPQLPHKNAAVRRHYRDYYNDRTRKLVAKRYGTDIDHFGYTF
jgi:Sulfotransferase family